MTTLEAAQAYVANGLSVIPVRPDGSKAPAFPGWRAFAYRQPYDLELRRWFAVPFYGVGVVCGPASGNLVVYDFESQDVWSKWVERAAGTPLAGLLKTCPVVVTPSGGRHVWVRLAAPAPGKVLARTPAGKTLIEIRGEGHQVLAPGCPGRCHPSGKCYCFESAGWLSGVA
jgi:putative DNA primase/helicase